MQSETDLDVDFNGLSCEEANLLIESREYGVYSEAVKAAIYWIREGNKPSLGLLQFIFTPDRKEKPIKQTH